MSRFVRWYLDISTRRPFVTNCIVGTCIAIIGDIGCQKFEQKYLNIPFQNKVEIIEKEPSSFNKLISSFPTLKEYYDIFDEELNTINTRRTLEMGFIRGTTITPFILFWYPTLLRLCPGTSVPRVLGRVLLDQVTGGPVCLFLIFLVKSAIAGHSLKECEELIKSNYYTAWYKGLQYWPFIHIVNFGFVPLRHQPLVAHFASIYWNAVLSYYANNKITNVENENKSEINLTTQH